MNRIYDITDKQIETLRAEAGTAGDDEQVKLCDAALNGDADARAECARVISAAADSLTLVMRL